MAFSKKHGQAISNSLLKRLPQKNEIISVFGIVVFVVYGWSVREFLYLFPSLSYFQQFDEILAVFFYMMAFALLESVLVTSLLVFPSMIFPEKWLRTGFSYKGFLAIVIASVESIQLQTTLTDVFPSFSVLYAYILIFLFAFVLLGILFHKIPFLQRLALAIIDRITIMTYLYVPLGLLGLVVMLVRNV